MNKKTFENCTNKLKIITLIQYSLLQLEQNLDHFCHINLDMNFMI